MGNNTEADISKIPGYKFAAQWQLNVKGRSGVTLTIAVISLFILSLFVGLMLHGLITGVKELSISISQRNYFVGNAVHGYEYWWLGR
jgi:hypothetical protein